MGVLFRVLFASLYLCMLAQAFTVDVSAIHMDEDSFLNEFDQSFLLYDFDESSHVDRRLGNWISFL